MKKKIYKTVIQIGVLSEEPINGMNLTRIVDEGDSGNFSIHTKDIIVDRVIVGKRAVNEMDKHGSDVEFFGMDKEGNELED